MQREAKIVIVVSNKLVALFLGKKKSIKNSLNLIWVNTAAAVAILVLYGFTIYLLLISNLS